MTAAQRNLIEQYNLTYEAEINGIIYYTREKEDGYYFVDSTDQCGIFESKKKFYQWANMRELLRVPVMKL